MGELVYPANVNTIVFEPLDDSAPFLIVRTCYATYRPMWWSPRICWHGRLIFRTLNKVDPFSSSVFFLPAGRWVQIGLRSLRSRRSHHFHSLHCVCFFRSFVVCCVCEYEYEWLRILSYTLLAWNLPNSLAPHSAKSLPPLPHKLTHRGYFLDVIIEINLAPSHNLSTEKAGLYFTTCHWRLFPWILTKLRKRRKEKLNSLPFPSSL